MSTALIALCSLAPAAADRGASAADATWTITYATRLRQLPGEASPIVVALDVGARVQVLGQRDRWLRARYRGKLGWIPRSTAAPPVDQAKTRAARPTERWRARTEIAVEGRARSVAGETVAPAAARRDRDSRVVADPDRARRDLAAGRRVRIRGGVGATTLGVDFQSDGDSALASYQISANAVAAAVSTDVSMPAGPLALAADVAYAVAIGAPGIRYQMAAPAAAPVAFSIQDFDAGLRVGARRPFGAVRAWGRAGWHLSWLHVGDVDNPGLLARERLTGLTLGGRLEAAIGRDVVGRAGADILIRGDRDQTPGLEDGASAAASAAWLSLSLGYSIASTLAIEGHYRFGRARTRWTGASQRQPDVTSAERVDHTHGFAIVIHKSFE